MFINESIYEPLINIGVVCLIILMVVICISLSIYLITSVLFYIPLSKSKRLKLEEKEAVLNLDKIKMSRDNLRVENIKLNELNLRVKEELVKLKNKAQKLVAKNDELKNDNLNKLLEEVENSTNAEQDEDID